VSELPKGLVKTLITEPHPRVSHMSWGGSWGAHSKDGGGMIQTTQSQGGQLHSISWNTGAPKSASNLWSRKIHS
jgi:hypothetical protein